MFEARINKPGDIVEYSANGHAVENSLGIVIADNGDVVTLIRLTTDPSDDSDIEIEHFGMRYGSSRRLQYVFSQFVKGCRRVLSVDQMAYVKECLIKTFELDVATPIPTKDDDIAIAKASEEVEFYKKMVGELLDRLAGNNGR